MEKKLIVIVLGVLGLITGVSYVTHDHDDGHCGIFEINAQCDLSGWVAIIYGDVLISVVLTLIFHYLISANSKKIETAIFKTDQIISEMKAVRDRRKAYVIQTLKNHFSIVLLCIGVINRFMNSDSDESKRIARSKRNYLKDILRKGQSTLSLAIDVLDPMTVEQIDKIYIRIIDSMSEETEDGKIPHVDEIKKSIKEITAKLDKYEHADHILK